MRALALLFRLGVALRNWLYDQGLLPRFRVKVPVVCAGSLEVGGAGKTPLAALLVRRLRARGLRVAVLARGYRSEQERAGARVAPEDDALRVGDEPRLFAHWFPGVPIYVGRNRVRSARRAVAEGAQVLVLDDGFQHRRLVRDLDVVIVDGGRDPAALRLLPAGPLREPEGSLWRAGLLVVRGPGDAPRGWRGRLVRVEDEIVAVRRLPEGDELPVTVLHDRKVSLLLGVARPERIGALVRTLGAEIVEERAFRDHHRFRSQDLEDLRGELLTTEKDAVRLPAGTRALVLVHRLRVAEGEAELAGALNRLET